MCATVTDLDFSVYITDCGCDSAGREWLFRAVNDGLAESVRPNCFLFTCESGSGKTAIARQLNQFSPSQVSAPGDLVPPIPGCPSASQFCFARDRYPTNLCIFTGTVVTLCMLDALRQPNDFYCNTFQYVKPWGPAPTVP